MFRLILLMAMGLGALYMMHLLAQDYNKIRQPVAAAARALAGASATAMRGKRDTTSALSRVLRLFRAKDEMPPATNGGSNNATLTIDWKRILSRDPFECLQSLICQLASGAEKNSREAVALLHFLEATVARAPAKIGHAFSRGLVLRGRSERCYDEYPFCVYSARTMLRVLKWFTETPYADADSEERQRTA